jgi:hypothetical protein
MLDAIRDRSPRERPHHSLRPLPADQRLAWMLHHGGGLGNVQNVLRRSVNQASSRRMRAAASIAFS